MQTEIVLPRTFQEARSLYEGAMKEGGGLVLISICETGSFSLSLKGNRFHIGTGDILILPPGMPIEDSDADSCGADIRYLGVRYRDFLRSIRTGRNVWTVLMYARSNPVFHLDENDRNLTSSYYKVIEGKLKTQRGYYYDEIIRSLLQCVIYELCVILNREMGTKEEDNSVRSKDVIFKKFMELLAEGEGRYRSLKYYSDALYVTPKYLSAVTNEVCGISAHEMVLNNVANHIQRELEFSETSVKELSVRFGFPNLSSFGKFVKTRLGKSPRAFRKDS